MLGQTIQNPPPASVVLDEVLLSFQARVPNGPLVLNGRTLSQPIRLDGPTDGSPLYFYQNLLNQDAANSLKDFIGAPGEDGRIVVMVKMEIRGYVVGSGAKISTGVVSFPIDVIDSLSDRDCGARGVLRNGCDGSAPCCVYSGQLSSPRFSCCDSRFNSCP